MFNFFVCLFEVFSKLFLYSWNCVFSTGFADAKIEEARRIGNANIHNIDSHWYCRIGVFLQHVLMKMKNLYQLAAPSTITTYWDTCIWRFGNETIIFNQSNKLNSIISYLYRHLIPHLYERRKKKHEANLRYIAP